MVGLVTPVIVTDHAETMDVMILAYAELVLMEDMENYAPRNVRHHVPNVTGTVANVKFVIQENLASSVTRRVSQTANILHATKQPVFVWNVSLESLA